MFASVLPNNKSVSLSPRDAGTLVLIYSEEATKMAKPGIDTSLAISGDPHSLINRVLLLNNQARAAMDKGQFDQAMEKLEEANKIMPDNQIVGQFRSDVRKSRKQACFHASVSTSRTVSSEKQFP